MSNTANTIVQNGSGTYSVVGGGGGGGGGNGIGTPGNLSIGGIGIGGGSNGGAGIHNITQTHKTTVMGDCVVENDCTVDGDLTVKGSLSVSGKLMAEMDDEHYIRILEERGYKIEGLVMKSDKLKDIQWLIKSGRVEEGLKLFAETFNEVKHLDLTIKKYYRDKYTDPKVARKVRLVEWNGQRIFIENGEVVE